MSDINNLFLESNFSHIGLLDGVSYPWDVIKKISPYINRWFNELDRGTGVSQKSEWFSLHVVENGDSQERILYVKQPVHLDNDLLLTEYNIFIGKGTILEPTAIIKSPSIIGSRCEIRQGAYIRGDVIVGDGSVVGHTTEIKHSVIMNHSEAGHFAYIGDSIIGSYVNLGAGTKIANLQFRTLDEKREKRKKTIMIKYNGEIIDTGLSKLGAIIGDGTELGCNSVTCPCAVIGKNSRIFPSAMVKKGIYPDDSLIHA